MHLGHQTAVRTNVPMFFDVLCQCCDPNGVPKCRVLRQIASHMRVGLYVLDMRNTLPETNIAPEKMQF